MILEFFRHVEEFVTESTGTRSFLTSFDFTSLPVPTRRREDSAGFSGAATVARVLEPTSGRLTELLNSGAAHNLSEAIHQLNPSEQSALRTRWGTALDEMLSLAHEHDATIFHHGLLEVGHRLEDADQVELAGVVYSALVAGNSPVLARAQARLNAMNGVGDWRARLAFNLERLPGNATRADMLFAIGGAGLVFRGVRLAATARWASSFESAFALNAAATSSAFLAETVAFTGFGRLAGSVAGHHYDWSAEGTFNEWAGGAAMLLGLKAMGGIFGNLSNRWAAGETAFARLTRAVAPQAGMFAGILTGNRLAELGGFHPERHGDTWFLDGLTTLLEFNVVGRLQRSASGPGLANLEGRMEAYTQAMAAGRPRVAERLREFMSTMGVEPQFVTAEGIRISASEIHSGSDSKNPLTQNAVFSVRHDGASGGGGGSSASGGGKGGSGEAPRRMDPREALGMTRIGTITPHGDEISTYERSVGNPAWIMRVGVMNGHLEYRGDGVFADKATGEPISVAETWQRYGERIRSETGFQDLVSETLLPIYGGDNTYREVRPDGSVGEQITEAQIEARFLAEKYGSGEPGLVGFELVREGVYRDLRRGGEVSKKELSERYGMSISGNPRLIRALPLPHDTDFAGQLPKGIRGEEGMTEARLREYLGLSKSQIRELSFGKSGSYLSGLDQYSLQGVLAFARGAMKIGAPLSELVGHNPEALFLSLTTAMGGGNSFVDLALAASRREYKAGVASTRTDPRTGTSELSAKLRDNWSGAIAAMIGPKGDPYAGGLDIDSVIRVLGDNPVDDGACATSFKALVRSAEAFKPARPGQTEVEFSFWGASEAPLGRIFSRPGITGFNGLGAMQTRANLLKRGATLETGYAPLTEDVEGFWPTEMAGVGGLGRVSRLVELGIPFDMDLAGYSSNADQGGKSNPAGLGDGGTAALRNALRMADRWQGVDPRLLQYMSLHGTGTGENNKKEPANLLRVLDLYGYEGPLRIAALKALLGHGLGAAGAGELGVLAAGMEHQLLPGAFNIDGRALDPSILALGARVLVSSEPMPGPIEVVGAQSQGFAGNNVALIMRRVSDRVLHEVFGYTLPQIEAYRRRTTERLDQTRAWEEDILRGRKTYGEFLSWFGLGSEPTPRASYHFLSAPGLERSVEAGEKVPDTAPADTVGDIDPFIPTEPDPSPSDARPSRRGSVIPLVELRDGNPDVHPESGRPASLAAALKQFVESQGLAEPVAPVASVEPPATEVASGPPTELSTAVDTARTSEGPGTEPQITPPGPTTRRNEVPDDLPDLGIMEILTAPLAGEAPPDSYMPPVFAEPPPPHIEMDPTPRSPGVVEGAPAIRRGIRVSPDQMTSSVGRGAMLTTRGTGLATRAAAMHGVDAPITLAYLSEDFGLTRYMGRDDAGREIRVRSDTGALISNEEIAAEFGDRMLRESGIREIPLEGDARGLPVRHAGMIPEPLRTHDRLLERMGMTSEALKGTPLENQRRNLGYASESGLYGLFVALQAQIGFGRPLHEVSPPSRFGASQGSAFPGIERLLEINDAARSGRDSLTYSLQSALLENARGLYLNMVLPHFNFAELEKDPRAIERIVPAVMGANEMPNTGGVNTAFSQACASALYALWGARMASIRTGVPGEYPMAALMVFGTDATLSPHDVAPALAGFSRKAPMTIDAMVNKLARQGRLPEEAARALRERSMPVAQIWNTLPEDLRRRTMNESSAPFTDYSDGLVGAAAAAGIPWQNFSSGILAGDWPSSLLLGIHVNAGEGGSANLASMDQGIVTATRVALRMAREHGVERPDLIQTHGTNTRLNNIAEIQSLYLAFRSMGISGPMAIGAIKGLVGHSMGAASGIDMVMGVQTLLDQEAPGLFNFRADDIDPRYAERLPEALRMFRFSDQPLRGGIHSLLITSEGFLSSDAAAMLGRFPQDVNEAADLLRDYNFAPHVIADWKVRAPETRARAEALQERHRRGLLTHRDIAIELGFNRRP